MTLKRECTTQDNYLYEMGLKWAQCVKFLNNFFNSHFFTVKAFNYLLHVFKILFLKFKVTGTLLGTPVASQYIRYTCDVTYCTTWISYCTKQQPHTVTVAYLILLKTHNIHHISIIEITQFKKHYTYPYKRPFYKTLKSKRHNMRREKCSQWHQQNKN